VSRVFCAERLQELRVHQSQLQGGGLGANVVLVDFWTYSCINGLRSIPYVRAWAQQYRDQDLIVIGVHADARWA
jgi:thiol-disulfide isomerase/thioredoxin